MLSRKSIPKTSIGKISSSSKFDSNANGNGNNGGKISSSISSTIANCTNGGLSSFQALQTMNLINGIEEGYMTSSNGGTSNFLFMKDTNADSDLNSLNNNINIGITNSDMMDSKSDMMGNNSYDMMGNNSLSLNLNYNRKLDFNVGNSNVLTNEYGFTNENDDGGQTRFGINSSTNINYSSNMYASSSTKNLLQNHTEVQTSLPRQVFTQVTETTNTANKGLLPNQIFSPITNNIFSTTNNVLTSSSSRSGSRAGSRTGSRLSGSHSVGSHLSGNTESSGKGLNCHNAGDIFNVIECLNRANLSRSDSRPSQLSEISNRTYSGSQISNRTNAQTIIHSSNRTGTNRTGSSKQSSRAATSGAGSRAGTRISSVEPERVELSEHSEPAGTDSRDNLRDVRVSVPNGPSANIANPSSTVASRNSSKADTTSARADMTQQSNYVTNMSRTISQQSIISSNTSRDMTQQSNTSRDVTQQRNTPRVMTQQSNTSRDMIQHSNGSRDMTTSSTGRPGSSASASNHNHHWTTNPENTLFLIDWDDTLCASTYCRSTLPEQLIRLVWKEQVRLEKVLEVNLQRAKGAQRKVGIFEETPITSSVRPETYIEEWNRQDQAHLLLTSTAKDDNPSSNPNYSSGSSLSSPPRGTDSTTYPNLLTSADSSPPHYSPATNSSSLIKGRTKNDYNSYNFQKNDYKGNQPVLESQIRTRQDVDRAVIAYAKVKLVELVSPEMRTTLHEFSKSLISFLQLTKKMGSIVIVTNADTGWVEFSCKVWLHQAYAEVAACEIVSARSSFSERAGIENTPSAWKIAAFEDILTKRGVFTMPPDLGHELPDLGSEKQGLAIVKGVSDLVSFQSGIQKPRNIISLGDAQHEREALWAMKERDHWNNPTAEEARRKAANSTSLKTALNGVDRNNYGATTNDRNHLNCPNKVHYKSIKLSKRPKIGHLISVLGDLMNQSEAISRYPQDLDLEYCKVSARFFRIPKKQE